MRYAGRISSRSFLRKLVFLVLGSAVGCSLATDFDGLSGGPSSRDAGLDAVPDRTGTGNEAGVTDAPTGDLGCSAPTAMGPIAYWPMEEGTGERVGDCRGGVNGTITGTVVWTEGRKPSTKALDFLGGYIALQGSEALDLTSSFSVVAWVKFEPDHNSGILSRGDQGADRGFSFELEADQSLSFYLASSPTAFTVTSAPFGTTRTWLHLAAVFDAGKSIAIYANGAPVVFENSKTLVASKPRLPLEIGRAWGQCCEMSGAIDEIRIFPRALSVDEIQQLAKE